MFPLSPSSEDTLPHEAAGETTVAVAEDAAAVAREAAGSAETPWGMVGNYALSILFAGVASVIGKWLKNCREALMVVTKKVKTQGAEGVKDAVKGAMLGRSAGVNAELARVLDRI